MKHLQLIPFFYFQQTRLNSVKALMFHSYMEWLSGFLILFVLEGYDFWDSLYSFLIGYLSFISIYEIGYIFNDRVSSKFEEKSRRRDHGLIKWYIYLAVSIRILCFLSLTYLCGFMTNWHWWMVYCLLILSFTLHNFIRNTDYRLPTFINLAFLRFFTPVFVFLNEEVLLVLVPPVLLGYVYFRTLIYMESKDLLNMKSRSEPLFKLSFYLLTLPVIGFISIVTNSVQPILIYSYFVFFMLIFYFKSIVSLSSD